MNNITTKGRIVEGKVISTKMQGTVIVAVTYSVTHPLYHKTLRRIKHMAAHNNLPDIKVGDKVKIGETRPVSKTVFFKVLEKIN